MAKTQLRVANVIEEGKLGGPQVRISIVAASLKNSVQTIVVMPKENSKEFRKRCDSLAVTYRILPITRITKEWRVALRYVLFFPLEILWLISVLKNEEVDVVHISGGSWQYKGVIAGKLAGKKVLWHLNDTSMPIIIRWIFYIMAYMSDGFIFASERSRSYYRPLIKKRKPEFVIPAPVDTTQFNPQENYIGDEDCIEKWGGKIVVGTVANVNPIKGLETFIRVAALYKGEQDVFFVVIGPVYANQKNYYESLKRLCNELGVQNIEFLGARSDVRPLVKRFDIYLCTSLAESSPISVWEAMAMGTPVISTDVGDVPLYVRDGDNGFIVNVEDSEALSERLKLLTSNSELRHQFGARCREVVVSELGLGRCAARHLNAYKYILE